MNIKSLSLPLSGPHLWRAYKRNIRKVTADDARQKVAGLDNWRESLFTVFITYLLPVCLLALIPGVCMAIHDGFIFLAVIDVFVFTVIALVIFSKSARNVHRKLIIISILYVLAIVLTLGLGLAGPGLVYLFALSVFVTLIFSTRAGYITIALSVLICFASAIIIHLGLFQSPLLFQYDLGAWIAISSNLIFLSWVSIALISYTIHRLEHGVGRQILLRKKLQVKDAERIERNALLSESEGHFKSLFLLNPSPMWVVDYETQTFLQVNEAAIRNYGYTNAEFLSMNLMQIKLSKDKSVLHRDLKANLEAGIPQRILSKHRRKSQEEFDVEVSFNAFSFKGKQAFLATCRDVSEQMNHLAAIEARNEKLREIAHIQSHSVRAPLARILGLVQLIMDDKGDRCDPELLAGLAKSATSLDEVIRTITMHAN